MATAPVQNPPRTVHKPLWWLLPFLAGLAVGLGLWAVEYTLREAAQRRKDTLQQMHEIDLKYGPRP